MRPGQTTHHGPGPFVTRAEALLENGRRLVATSRRHRKGLAPHTCAAHEVMRIPPTRRTAFGHLLAPRRIGWWVAVLFAVGSLCFMVGGWAASWPAETPSALLAVATINAVFFVGSIFFTAAAYLQLLEAANGDVAHALRPSGPDWRWFGWRPHNLGWLASAVQFVGTVAFNFNTADAMIAGLSWEEEDLLIWTPNMVGCVCFLTASGLAWVELSHGAWSFAPRSVSWWTAVANLAGSVVFQLSALHSFVRPGPPDPHELWLAAFYTFVGAVCFLVGAYLLVPELFDGEPRDP
jgi:hypothetical protein